MTPMTTTRLTDAEWSQLAEANRLLTALTAGHRHTCGCPLCEARALTDVQEEGSRTVRHEPADAG